MGMRLHQLFFALQILAPGGRFWGGSIKAVGATTVAAESASADHSFDVLVYGATSGGVMAAVAAARTGAQRVALLDPGSRIGGMTAGGLSATDVGHSNVIGGMALELYKQNGLYYGKRDSPEFNWEPHVALELLHRLIKDANVSLFSKAQVESVEKSGTRLTSLTTLDGRTFTAGVFVEADYEGDLMARAGVSWTYGREGTKQYNESLAGYRLSNQGHEFSVAIDPYITGTQELLPMLSAWDPPATSNPKNDPRGEPDNKTQSYNFRLCVTTNKSNSVAFVKPHGYDPSYWELARRYFTHPLIAPKVHAPCGNIDSYCGGGGIGLKIDLNNGGPISTDFVGGSWRYPNASYAEREAIFQAHKFYTQSFLWFMSTDPALNISIRSAFQQYGLCKDEFVDTDHWPPQLYVRAARRLVGDHIFTQNVPLENRSWGNLSIGCGSYNFDSHTIERFACPNASACIHASKPGEQLRRSYAWNEGDVQTAPGIYDIPLWVLLPKRVEATNLLVVATPSASHIGMSTLRMEPQFMIMGQSAGTIAAMALRTPSKPVHDIDVDEMHQLLLQGRQLMNSACNPPPVVHVKSIIVSGAGTTSCNGIYNFDPAQHRDPGTAFYAKDAEHQLYRLHNVWRIAHSAVGLYYEASGGSDLPPATGWTAIGHGAAPVPTLRVQNASRSEAADSRA
jgi:hypothetical protein